ncbi:MAG: hypothetical protein JXA50_11515 [Deltaproteobacteria bacterium]|nr:hypothetical protein [Deltaproteobacteria bacterium]
MTPLDRILSQYPAIKEILFFLNDNLPLIFGISFFLFILFIFYWAFFRAPRKAAKLLRGLEQKGYSPVRPDDPQLKNTLERLTPIMFHTYKLSTVRETSPWRVKLAYGQHDSWTNRFFALINRSVIRTPPGKRKWEHQFTIAFFEIRPLPFRQEVHIAGDRYKLDPEYGLHAVGKDAIGLLSSRFVIHTRDGKLDPLPALLQDALIACAPFLSIRAVKKGHLNDPFLFYARIRFTPEGWGLISNEYVYNQKKMDALLEVVDRISLSLE